MSCGGGVSREIPETVRFRSLAWWAQSSRAKGANHGKPTHARSGPRRRWETLIHNYAVDVLGQAWIDALGADDAFKHKGRFASSIMQ